LAVFVDSEKDAVEGVDVGGKHGERLGQEEAQAETAGVGVEDIDAALNGGGGRGRGRGAGQERLIEKRAGGMHGETGN